ncbi:bifunctional lysylphosphatidylglycerol flippase/synthetase MprF [Gammaproteobacteria bacterium PRO2]|nr:bifunctional lysylphosphatidylglycerol flippase/synthetase MprF [Gammaproteobacteria bacterium PRO2]
MAPDMPRRWIRMLPAVTMALAFGIALVTLHQLSGELRLQDILAASAGIGRGAIALALLLAAGSYAVLTLYDLLALREVGCRLPYGRAAATSFIAWAFGHSVGMVTLSAGAMRYRLYSLAGLGAAEITQVVVFCALTFHLGAGLLTGFSLIIDAGNAASLLHAAPALSQLLGMLVLVLVAGWVALTAWRREPLRLGGWSLPLPAWPTTLLQIAVSATDLLLACGVLYALLPAEAATSFTSFAGLYMVALVVGAVSTVPGGLGVFESMLLLLMPAAAPGPLLGALLAYRVIYFVLPFLLAIALLCGFEAWRQRRRLRVAWDWTRRSLDFVVPPAMAMLAFLAGVVLLFSGATPALAERIRLLQGFLPLPVLEISQLAGSAIGVALLLLARGLYYRLDAAWHLMLWLLGAGIVASLLKGLDYEESAMLLLVLLALYATRRQFYRRASLLAEPLEPRWLAAVAMAIGASIWVGLIAQREVPYQNELWWQFAFDANAPRMLRGSLVAVLGLGVAASWRLLQPARRSAQPASAADIGRAAAVLQAVESPTGNLALLGDKSLLFSASGQGFIMYGISGHSWIAMGDPVAADEERGELVWQFRELCDRGGGRCVFYQVAGDNLPAYIDAGLSLSKLGEEARVRLEEFTIEGSARAHLRQARRKAEREGASFRVAAAAELPALLPALRRVSDDWLAAKSAAEKGFSLGYFDTDYLCRFPCALVESGGELVAFANLWPGARGIEVSVDLMRHSQAAPRGIMDYLFVEIMLWCKAQGFQWFSLGMAPLAGLEEHRLAPPWHRLGRLVYRYGENFYNFEGLRQYKEKFLPQWRPRYLAAPGGVALPRVLLDVTTLISGGIGGAVGKPAPDTTRETHRHA